MQITPIRRIKTNSGQKNSILLLKPYTFVLSEKKERTMTTEFIEVNDWVVMKEQSVLGQSTIEVCDAEEAALGFLFYGSGQVRTEIKYHNRQKMFQAARGQATSFFSSADVQFTHHVFGGQALKSIGILLSVTHLQDLVAVHPEGYSSLKQILNPQDDFVFGPSYLMTPDMQQAVDKIFNSTYTGVTQKLLIESQAIELMAHFLGMATQDKEHPTIRKQDKERLFAAKDILTENLETPPSLSELSRLVGLNDYKLKKGFKQLFGMPVYKYLQQERLKVAHNLLKDKEISVYQAALSVGYESLSSFSNAFNEKFGYRPSKVK